MYIVAKKRRDHAIKAYSQLEKQSLEDDLATLADFSKKSPVPVYLTGGLSLSVINGSFYRRHHDIDLCVFTHELHDFAAYARTQGYDLLKKVCCAAVGTHTVTGLVQTNPDRILAQRQKGVRLFNPDVASPRLQVIDLFVDEQLPNGDVRTMKGNVLPYEAYYPIYKVPYANGTFHIPNPAFLLEFKQSADVVTRKDREYIATCAAQKLF